MLGHIAFTSVIAVMSVADRMPTSTENERLGKESGERVTEMQSFRLTDHIRSAGKDRPLCRALDFGTTLVKKIGAAHGEDSAGYLLVKEPRKRHMPSLKIPVSLPSLKFKRKISVSSPPTIP